MLSATTKKVASILFLFLGLMPWTFILLFYIRQQEIRHEMKEKLEANLPQHAVTIPDKDVKWIEKGKELRVNGRMFDVKTWYSKDGYTHLKGLYDEEETILNEQLEEGWKKQSPGNEKLLSQIINALNNIFFENGINSEIPEADLNNDYPFLAQQTCSQVLQVLKPPPRS